MALPITSVTFTVVASLYAYTSVEAALSTAIWRSTVSNSLRPVESTRDTTGML